MYFYTSFEPVEMHTSATEQLIARYRVWESAGIRAYAEYSGYSAVSLLVAALQGTDPNPTRTGLIAALSKITNFNSWGLSGRQSISMTDRSAELRIGTATAAVSGAKACVYVTKLSGTSFHLIPGMDPICGTVIPGVSG